MSINEISLFLIASSSAGNEKETWKFCEEEEGAENQSKAAEYWWDITVLPCVK